LFGCADTVINLDVGVINSRDAASHYCYTIIFMNGEGFELLHFSLAQLFLLSCLYKFSRCVALLNFTTPMFRFISLTRAPRLLI
jgi:hypothetical protein